MKGFTGSKHDFHLLARSFLLNEAVLAIDHTASEGHNVYDYLCGQVVVTDGGMSVK
jgi:hypothetical protein